MPTTTKTWQEEEQQFINQSANDINKELSRTWQERFDDEFYITEYKNIHGQTIECWPSDEEQREYKSEPSDIKQFISDIRKRDMEALIRMLPKKKLGHINQEGFCDDCGYKICRCYQTNSIVDTFKKIIKDYYEN